MNKIYYLVLILPLLFLSSCSLQDKHIEKSNTNIQEKQSSIKHEKQQNNKDIVYNNNEFGFKIIMPLSWHDYQVKKEKVVINKYGKSYNVFKLNFGFPVKINYNPHDNSTNTEKCTSCFTKIFTLTIYNKADFQQIKKDNDIEIAKNGNNQSTDLGRIIGDNNNYVFSVPSNIHGQSYEGQFIYDRQTEAATFLSYFETY